MGLSSALLLRRKCVAAAFAGGGRGAVHHPSIATTTASIDVVVAAQAAGRPRPASTSSVVRAEAAAARPETAGIRLGCRWPTAVSDPLRRQRSVAATVPSADDIVRFRSFSSSSSLDGLRHADSKANKSDNTSSSSSFWDDDSILGLDRSESAPSPSPKAPSAIPLWERTEPRRLPTKHSSRQFPGPVCPHRSLQSVTDELLNSEVGSLFSFYDGGGEDERRRIHEARERFEYCLRGHSALIPGSYLAMNARNWRLEPRWRLILESSLSSAGTGDGEGEGEAMTISQRVGTMYDLIQRLEEEGELYRRSQRGVLSVASSEDDGSDEEDLLFGRDYHHEDGYDEEGDLFPGSDSSSSDSDSDGDSDEEDEEIEVVDFQGEVDDEDDADSASTAASTDVPSPCVDALPGIGGGAAPGPSTKMYDLVLDAYAVAAAAARSNDPDDAGGVPPVEAIERSRRLLNTVLTRHGEDGGRSNVDPHTMPTSMSFNAPIRTAAAVVPSSDEAMVVRDEALDLAFVTYDKMFRCDCVRRNAATYKYMLDVVVKFLPPSRSKGNIAYGVFTKAKEEGVVNGAVLNAAVALGVGNGGVDYDAFLAHLEKEGVKSRRDLPLKWRRNNLRRRQPYSWGVY